MWMNLAKTKQTASLWITAISLGHAVPALAGGWGLEDPFQHLQRLPVSGEQIRIFPETPTSNQNLGLVGNPTWNRLARQNQPLRVVTETLLREVGLHHSVSLNLVDQESGIDNYQFAIGGYPICGFQIKSYVDPASGYGLFGAMPNVRDYTPPSIDAWPELATTLQVIGSYFNPASDEVTALNPRRCLQLVDGGIRPAWEMIVRIDDLPYLARADDHELFHTEKRFISATTSEVKVYDTGPSDGKLVTYKFNLVGDGTLTSEFVTTDPQGVARAKATDNKFNFEPTDKRFDEASSFAHVSIMLAWFVELGYQWTGAKPITVRNHVVFSGNNVNNALYQPSESTQAGAAWISVGDGDGKILKNLGTDADVVEHELGHHVVYRNLKSVEGESLVLHEGLADFFTFMHAGNPCLGESICPANSPACWTQGQCLRTADNDLNLTSNEFKSLEPHLQGQLISGVLWDLRAKQSIPAEQVTKIGFKSISFLVESSGFGDFVSAVFLADRDLHSSNNACKIFEAFTKRGFGSYLKNIDCKSPDTFGKAKPTLADKSSAGGSAAGKATGSGGGRKTSKSSCGTIAFAESSSLTGLLTAGVLLLPIMMALFPRPAPSRVRSRNGANTKKQSST
jgi:Thermolysin metallopeptidase, catalytic domain